MKLIQTITLTSAASSIEFTSIPQTFTDLVVLVSSRVSVIGVSAGIYINFNGDFTAGNYARRLLLGDGSSTPTSITGNSVIHIGNTSGNTSTANTFGNSSVYIPNYTASTAKSVSADGVGENNATTANQVIAASSWTGTAAISSIVIYSDGGNLTAGSTASLYGITKGTDGIVTTS